MRLTVWLGTCAILLASAVIAQEAPKQQQMSAEEKAAMEAMMKAATPGDAHKKLEPMVGNFVAKVTMWQAPGAPPQITTGVSHTRWVLGGRWVEQVFRGTMMGKPFSGIGFTGYDNIKNQYVGTWMDTMTTSMIVSTGPPSANNVFDGSSTMEDPVSGKDVPVKFKTTVTDNDHHTMEMWSPAPDGTMFKMMDITYTRKK